ncbi:putative phosphate phosphoenolpyruvate translocator protein [Polychaeton citri CBS 116435]|uniref:Phosphate phosphoenolpyruvate translocator protein n=1 Tax=Polychaeton citri CBS 116435 TaxID=1314669 RepID=A0A9P4Q9H6_9PEZI|nr:putative phosphate phosphoenolpyruvate translocator protein [Polychaeton citri CBS 116435]
MSSQPEDPEKGVFQQQRNSIDDTQPTEGLLKQEVDVEAQQSTQPQATATEHNISLKSKLSFLAVYFVLNLALTLSNKAVLSKANYPWLLTALHTSATSIGCFGVMGSGYLKLTRLGSRENLVLVAFSFLFTLNIAMSNVSLAMVSVPFHQIARSTCPVATILVYRVAYGRTYSQATYLSMIPLIMGVALATAGDYYCTLLGFTLTFVGVILAAIKTVATNRLMTGSLSLSAMEVLLRMSPLAAMQCFVYAWATGELHGFRVDYGNGKYDYRLGWGLLLNASIAFFLNIVSFQTNKVAGALTMSVCGNLKQMLTIALGIILFNVKVGPLNAVGMLVTISGAAWYSKVELDNKRAKAQK